MENNQVKITPALSVKTPKIDKVLPKTIDFDDLSFLGIKDTDYNKLLSEGKYKLGYIFNLELS